MFSELPEEKSWRKTYHLKFQWSNRIWNFRRISPQIRG